MKKFLLSLFAVAMACVGASAEVIDFSFSGGFPSEKWETGYANHAYEDENYSVSFSSFSKQTVNINDYPVTKNGNVILTLKNDETFQSVKFNLEQWGSKAHGAALKYFDGEEYVDFDPEITSADFSIEATEIPAGVTSIMLDLSYSDTGNQVGVRSVEYAVVDNSLVAAPTFTPAGGFLFAGQKVEISCATEGAAVFYSVNDGDVVEYVEPIEFQEDGSYVIDAFATLDDEMSDVVSASFTYTSSELVMITDRLTADVFGAKDDTYHDVTWTSEVTGITYSANMMKSQKGGVMQIRSKNDSGIVTSGNPNGYLFSGYTVMWDSETVSPRQLGVYLADSDFSAPNDLYADGLEADYVLDYQSDALSQEPDEAVATAVGFRSVNGAQYVEYIEIQWLVAPAEAPVEPETPGSPEVSIDGVEITDFSEPIDLNQASVTITLTADEGHHIYHKHEPAEETVNPAYYYEGADAEPEDPHAGFTHVADNKAEIEVNQNGTLTYYAFHPETQLKSEPVSIRFINGIVTVSIGEVETEKAAREVFDLQGRRVAAPVRELYIIDGQLRLSK
ncbi:MAG: chitobiase/beta-hexosaminidase C-terminal domain-containing protein [Muribaculaceae bacterium]|nr:chitobiase/beta-hexosaminidase C-terminal domain-containing protein [Muribaculaceae bacterium]